MGIGVVELFVVLAIVGACFGGLVLAVILGVKAANGPRSCPHCGKPLR